MTKQELQKMNRDQIKSWCMENNVEFSNKDNTKRIISRAVKSLSSDEPPKDEPIESKPSKKSKKVKKNKKDKKKKSKNSLATYRQIGKNILLNVNGEKYSKSMEKETREEFKTGVAIYNEDPTETNLEAVLEYFKKKESKQVEKLVITDAMQKIIDKKVAEELSKRAKQSVNTPNPKPRRGKEY